jgi:transposase-like protein
MNNLSTSVNSSLEWRRNKVQELARQGYNQSEISRILQVSIGSVNRDLSILRQQAKEHKAPNRVMYKVCKFYLYAYLCISTSQYHT